MPQSTPSSSSNKPNLHLSPLHTLSNHPPLSPLTPSSLSPPLSSRLPLSLPQQLPYPLDSASISRSCVLSREKYTNSMKSANNMSTIKSSTQVIPSSTLSTTITNTENAPDKEETMDRYLTSLRQSMHNQTITVTTSPAVVSSVFLCTSRVTGSDVVCLGTCFKVVEKRDYDYFDASIDEEEVGFRIDGDGNANAKEDSPVYVDPSDVDVIRRNDPMNYVPVPGRTKTNFETSLILQRLALKPPALPPRTLTPQTTSKQKNKPRPKTKEKDPATLRSTRARHLNTFTVPSYKSPLETIENLRIDEREHMNLCLTNERYHFFKLLRTDEKGRIDSERSASVVIQKHIRGFIVRLNRSDVINTVTKRRFIIRDFTGNLKSSGSGEHKYVFTKGNYKDKMQKVKGSAAVVVQCFIRCCIAGVKVKTVKERNADAEDKRKSDILKNDKKRIAKEDEDRRNDLHKHNTTQTLSATIVQKTYRGHRIYSKHMAIRNQKRLTAILTLQNFRRCCISNRKVLDLRKILFAKKQYLCSFKLVRFFRRIVDGNKGRVIRTITKKFVREFSAVKIQVSWRMSFAYRGLKGRLFMSAVGRRFAAVIQIQRVCRGFVGRQRAERVEEEGHLDEHQHVGESVNIPEQLRRRESLTVPFIKMKENDEDAVEEYITFQDHSSETNKIAYPNDVDHNGNTLLACAASRGQLKIMRKCLVWGTDPNIKNNKGFTAIDLAVKFYQGVAAEYLLSKVSVKFDGVTLLHEACVSGMSRLVISLCESGVEPDCVDVISENEMCPLHVACDSSVPEWTYLDKKVVRGSRNTKAFKRPTFGKTAIPAAASASSNTLASVASSINKDDDDDNQDESEEESEESEDDSDDGSMAEEEQNLQLTKHSLAVLALLNAGADPAIADKHGNTCLHYAAKKGSPSCARVIIEHANGLGRKAAMIVDSEGRTPFAIACLEGNVKTADLLKKCAISVVELEIKSTNILQEDVRRFAIGLTTPDTITPKTYRLKLRRLDNFDQSAKAHLLRELVANAQIPIDSRVDLDGTTAIMNAAKASNTLAFSACLDMGASLLKKDNVNRTASHCMSGCADYVEAVKMVNFCIVGCEYGGGMEQNPAECFASKDDKGRTAVHYAAYRGNAELLNLFNSKNYASNNLNSSDDAGNTPLHYTCSISKDTYKNGLDDLGLSCNLDVYTTTPNKVVVEGVIRMLLKNGADVTAVNKAGKTALVLACEHGNLPAVKLLTLHNDWRDFMTDEKLSKYLINAACACANTTNTTNNKNLECLRTIVKHDKYTAAFSHASGPDGITLLGTAIKSLKLSQVTLCVEELTINPTKQCYNGGGNSLHACALWGSVGILKYLGKHHKVVPNNYERKNALDETPLVVAIKSGSYPIAMELIRRGCVVNDACKMKCEGWLMSAGVSQGRKGKGFGTIVPRCLVWRGRKFFAFGMQGESKEQLGMIAAGPFEFETSANGGRTGGRFGGGANANANAGSRPNTKEGGGRGKGVDTSKREKGKATVKQERQRNVPPSR